MERQLTTDTITIRRPDDLHVHLRDGAMLRLVAPYTARQFARAIIMPNLAPPVTRVGQAAAYRDRIFAATEPGFTPLMTTYLTNDSDPDELERGHRDGVWVAAKLYPAGATTNSASGVTDIGRVARVLERMERIGMPLLVHGEVTDPAVDVFDREAVFIDRILLKTLADFPALKIVFEHITTRHAADLVLSATFPNLAATITPHHLMLNRNALFEGGLRPHAYCLPVVKREEHRIAVRKAAVSGSPNIFLGTDSAPHVVGAKESSCGCAGLFNAPFAIEAYAQVFDEEGALDKLEGFASEHGARFYGLALNDGSITLQRGGEEVPAAIGEVVPFGAGLRFGWRLIG
jgi:dihydroorotase